MPTKHRIMRLTNDDWQRLADALLPVVPASRRPKRARGDSQWWVVEGLRMIARGELRVTVCDAEQETP